jgi:hypothetical protein
MDPELQKRIDAAKAQGFTDEEIQQALGSDTGKSAQPEATMPGGYNVPILSAEEKARFEQSQQQIDASNKEQNFETGATALGMGAAAVGVPAALLYGAKRILSPGVQSGAELAQRGVGAMEQANALARETEDRVAKNQAMKAGMKTAGPVAPSPILDATGRPMQAPGPVAPPQAQPASMANRVQAAAANKIQNLPGAGMMGSAGRMAGRLLPGAGTVLNAADAYSRAKEGDYLGAGIAGVGAAASPFPVLGTAVGVGTGALNAYRDYRKRQEEEKKRMAQ